MVQLVMLYTAFVHFRIACDMRAALCWSTVMVTLLISQRPAADWQMLCHFATGELSQVAVLKVSGA